MKISSKLAMGIHVLIAIDRFSGEYKVTSDFLAGSLQVNPVMVRQILVGLNGCGITEIADRKRGVELSRPLGEITMQDVYFAVEGSGKSIFGFHSDPNEKCPVGKNIHAILDSRLDSLQREFEDSLKNYHLSDIAADLDSIIGGKSE